MNQCEFWDQVGLTILDKGLLALIVLVAGFYLNRVLEVLKGKLSQEQEFVRTANGAVVDLTKKLAAGSHLISWLSWSATQSGVKLFDRDFTAYDKAMIEVLSDLVGLQASVAALDPGRFPKLSKFAEALYARDVNVGEARELFRTKDPAKEQQCVALLKSIYDESLKFDKDLLAAVTGLLAPARKGR
ncbi:MAG: hypothetical protein WCA45_12010 [Thiobacillaceae bacterium]